MPPSKTQGKEKHRSQPKLSVTPSSSMMDHIDKLEKRLASSYATLPPLMSNATVLQGEVSKPHDVSQPLIKGKEVVHTPSGSLANVQQALGDDMSNMEIEDNGPSDDVSQQMEESAAPTPPFHQSK